MRKFSLPWQQVSVGCQRAAIRLGIATHSSAYLARRVALITLFSATPSLSFTFPNGFVLKQKCSDIQRDKLPLHGVSLKRARFVFCLNFDIRSILQSLSCRAESTRSTLTGEKVFERWLNSNVQDFDWQREHRLLTPTHLDTYRAISTPAFWLAKTTRQSPRQT